MTFQDNTLVRIAEMGRILLAGFVFALTACATVPAGSRTGLDAIARDYVHLQLEIGAHDDSYIDNYFGPAEWRTRARARPRPLDLLRDEAVRLLDALSDVEGDRQMQRRKAYLVAHLRAAHLQIEILEGARVSFAEETETLFGLRPRLLPLEAYDPVLARIDALLPAGAEPLNERMALHMTQFAVPPAQIDRVMRTAIDECRRRTAANMSLPPNETTELLLVRDREWSGAIIYHGDYRSTVQINTSLPLAADRVVELACHESYPGHHVHAALLDWRLVRQRGWIEYSIVPLVGPIGLIAEGGASCAPYLAFPGAERERYEDEVIFPMAGVDRRQALAMRRLRAETSQLRGARLTIGQMYLDGAIDRERTIELLQRYQVTSRPGAEQIVAFMERYRTYMVNYVLGEEAVCARLAEAASHRGGAGAWRAMAEMLSEPTLPSDFQDASTPR